MTEKDQPARRRAAMHAAAQVLAEKGYSSAKLSDIAERAGIQAGSLYYYFESKESMVEEVLTYGVRASRLAIEDSLSRLDPDAEPERRLRVAIERMMLAALENSDYTAAHLRCVGQIPDSSMPALFAEVRRMNRLWQSLMVQTVASADDIDMNPTTVRLLIMGAISWTVEWPEHARRPANEVARTLAELVVRGLHAPTAR